MVNPIEPRRQQRIIDVVHWEADAEFGVFPQGARAKEAVFSPQRVEDVCITPSKRYLFKRSKKSYPDQYWGEIVAYRVGCAMGLQVPPAFAAYNTGTGHSAALIEWFYEPPERFVHAGDYMQRIVRDFDRTRGTQHTLAATQTLMRAFAKAGIFQQDWKSWLVEMFAFDAVIGNTDRHQDNWGFIFSIENGEGVCRLSPLFDNGTSLGHERFPDRINGWRDADFANYVSRGRHHMGELRTDTCLSVPHMEMVGRVVTSWPKTRNNIAERLQLLDERLPDMLNDLVDMGGPVPLTEDRARFMLRLLSLRLEALRTVIK